MPEIARNSEEAERDLLARASEVNEEDKDGIVVAEYWTALPPKAELRARIQQIYEAAAERVARRKLEASSQREDNE
ncbi:hypothetical protein HMPREF0183_1790 [Brevibacterium mcbrellneri ATCC 49030]|uniref:Uncharacterized protein n=1 Tax=Brevibacterium mcbrellneri ATCC 49030 TaxID=585530 RepID=D4YPD0_9MICO|nr:hypothetical protein [Brevibacterium mcbrellneri]EFG46942.1 hypothetical protein HMPREF0183_1790 [Brevibacterium mcbrellneri ATCC 49030]